MLRNSIYNTKKFFQKTIDNVKSFLSKGSAYEKLPKTPPIRGFGCGRDGNDYIDIDTGCKDLDNFYVEFTHRYDSQKAKVKNRFHKIKKSQEFHKKGAYNENFVTPATIEAKENITPVKINQANDLYPQTQVDASENEINRVSKQSGHSGVKEVAKGKGSDVIIRPSVRLSDFCSRSVRERRLSSVARKLKELEVMDKGNPQHKMDVEEVLHYYGSLTCPAYLDIVDRFFMEICTEFFGPQSQQVSLPLNSATPTLRC